MYIQDTSSIKDKIISADISILSALKVMDNIRCKMLFVYDDTKFDSILTIGDIQRAIIRNVSLSEKVSSILDRNKIFASENDTIEDVKKVMLERGIDCMPFLNANHDIIRILFWSDIFNSPFEKQRQQIHLPVVIMAGGKGTRLKPITNVIPKPLVPVGEKTIIEVIMDQFESIGCNKFFISVNYKADMMNFYLSQLKHKYDIEYFMEDRPLGTIGSVSLLKGKIKTPFFVSNCDSINDQDYRDVYDYHVNNHNDLTIVTMVKSFKIPYGIIETGSDGIMVELKEKPEMSFKVNTGVYILNPELVEEIPEGEFFHITQLMEKVKSKGGRVGCFPVSEGAWHDIGEWPDYLKMIKVF